MSKSSYYLFRKAEASNKSEHKSETEFDHVLQAAMTAAEIRHKAALVLAKTLKEKYSDYGRKKWAKANLPARFESAAILKDGIDKENPFTIEVYRYRSERTLTIGRSERTLTIGWFSDYPSAFACLMDLIAGRRTNAVKKLMVQTCRRLK